MHPQQQRKLWRKGKSDAAHRVHENSDSREPVGINGYYDHRYQQRAPSSTRRGIKSKLFESRPLDNLT